VDEDNVPLSRGRIRNGTVSNAYAARLVSGAGIFVELRRKTGVDSVRRLFTVNNRSMLICTKVNGYAEYVEDIPVNVTMLEPTPSSMANVSLFLRSTSLAPRFSAPSSSIPPTPSTPLLSEKRPTAASRWGKTCA
jgi:hypothetical protein